MIYILSFLFFQWEQIDWEKWMPVEVGALLILILLIRVLRRWRRWGPVKVSHVSKEKWTLGGYSGEMYYNRLEKNYLNSINNAEIRTNSENKHLNSELTKESSRILYISPLSFNKKIGPPIPTSLSVMGFDVLCITPSEFYSILRLESNPHSYFQKLINTYSVQSVICFDHAWSSCVKYLLRKQEKIPQLNYIILRPTGSWLDIKPLTQLILHPLQFLSRIHLRKYMPKKKDRKDKIDKKEIMENTENKNNLDGNLPLEALETPSTIVNFKSILFIHPKTTWLTDHGKKRMNSWIEKLEAQYGEPKIQNYQFSQGDWWFYRNETVILGLIARILLQ